MKLELLPAKNTIQDQFEESLMDKGVCFHMLSFSLDDTHYLNPVIQELFEEYLQTGNLDEGKVSLLAACNIDGGDVTKCLS